MSAPSRVFMKLGAGLLVFGLAAPASAQLAATARGGPIALRVGDAALAVSVDADTVRGDGFALRRDGARLTGTVRGGNLDLRWRRGLVTGRVGVEDVHLELSRMASEQGLQVDGELASWGTALVLSPLGITGSVGGCDYSMTVAGGQYTGWRTCQESNGGEPLDVTLSLPEQVQDLDDAEQAVLVALVLSEKGIAPTPPRATPGPGRTLEGPGAPAPGR
ncbi:hypothetical protein LZ198_24905 [Myxococcus sp. K15C18031901]|uniref:hypothetical protein n=1 Tax=Myxococcus dinghuensis TaxID=2906761 RepID=UPI0020A76DCD|nr:hypothetical protein [Myxococcus dinghuensis]MCP3102113.1 hypothetical protein [Myxococcus dinghuensis]